MSRRGQGEEIGGKMKNANKLIGAAAAIILLTFVAYMPALRGGFVWDDDVYVTQNPLLTAPDGLKRIWFSMHRQSQYFPLVYTTLRFEHMLWGLNPLGYHVVNVLLHSLNALLVWAVLKRLALPGAWLAAAIWDVHPVNVESVAWITELKNTQSTFFYLLALLAWMKFTDKETRTPWRLYALTLVLYALALFSKTTACTFSAAMLVVLWLKNEPIRQRRLIQIAPFVVLGVGFGLLSVWWESHLGNYREDVGQSLSGLEKLLVATRALWFYAAKLVWPTRLTFSYPRWEINPNEPLQYLWLVGCFAVALFLWWRRNLLGRGPVGAVIFFAATLSPLLGFIPLYTFRFSFVADHYQYVASVGLIALFAVASTQELARRLNRPARCVLSLLVLLVLGTLTWQQTYAYRDIETLWQDTLVKNPHCWMAHNNLGVLAREAGRVEEAIEHYREALQLNPDYAEAHCNLGNALAQTGRNVEAIEHYEQALQIDPNYLEVHNNMAFALLQSGKVDDAVHHLERAVRINPGSTEAHYNLALAQAQQGRLDEAQSHFETALKLNPDYPEAHYMLAILLAKRGHGDAAILHLQTSVQLDPRSERYRNALAALQRIKTRPTTQ